MPKVRSVAVAGEGALTAPSVPVWSHGNRPSPARRILLLVWMGVGLAPLVLQVRSFLKFVSPHKISRDLLAPNGVGSQTVEMEDRCPLEGAFIAGVWWNIDPVHYFEVPGGRLCHFVIPQYNIHGNYFLGYEQTLPSLHTPHSCTGPHFVYEHYFYHGSIGYYSFYEEAEGSYCVPDKTAYVDVGALGTVDLNGEPLRVDKGSTHYRVSYWYGIAGATWIAYRALMLRRSFVSCKRFGRRCDRMGEVVQFQDAIVYVQESMRLSAHGAKNYHRAALLYLLVEGVMADLFLLIAQEGIIGRLQYISLGYNLSGVLSMLFEMFESMQWMRERTRCMIKRLFFNHETVLLGECLCAGVMQHFLTSLNHSHFEKSRPSADTVSYYVWSLVGHGAIVLSCAGAILSVRALGAIAFVRWKFGCLNILMTHCCVDTTLGLRTKLILLGGYAWENQRLYYKVRALKAFGIMRMIELDGSEYLVLHKIYWTAIPRHDLFAIGAVTRSYVKACKERRLSGTITMFGRMLGSCLCHPAGTRRTISSGPRSQSLRMLTIGLPELPKKQVHPQFT